MKAFLVGVGLSMLLTPLISRSEPSNHLDTYVPDSLVPPPQARHPDSAMLATFSRLHGVPVFYTWSLAWEETRSNPDSTVRSSKGALGRFQIMDATARGRCPLFDVRTPAGNLACFLKMTREDRTACGSWWCAARIHNGSGPDARAFADRVVRGVGELHSWSEDLRQVRDGTSTRARSVSTAKQNRGGEPELRAP